MRSYMGFMLERDPTMLLTLYMHKTIRSYVPCVPAVLRLSGGESIMWLAVSPMHEVSSVALAVKMIELDRTCWITTS
jgi:hypothetical protein